MSHTCASQARAHDEPRAGTAPYAVGWVLVEQAGPWGRDALTASGLDPAVGAALGAAVADLPVRAQVVRRPGRGTTDRTRPRARTVVLVHSGPTPWAETVEMTDDELAGLDPASCLRREPPGLGIPTSGPLELVCTHAKRDRCCATLGRPIADTLAALHLETVWESSHVGGHRFAGNLVVLPEGLVYGGLDVATAVQVTDLHRAGRLELTHLRGRSALARPAQAAEILLRRELDVDAIDAVEVLEVTTGAGDVSTVGLRVRERGDWQVQVAKQPLGASYLTSCDAAEPEDPGGYVLLDLTRA